MSLISQRIFFLTALSASAYAAAQTCQPSIRATAPTSRYTVDSAHGTVLDKKTGLTWKRCPEGLSGTSCATGTLAHYNWGNALTQAANTNYAGYKDWHLPNSKELVSLVEEKCYSPAINLAVFPNNTSEWYWSSSPSTAISFNAWMVGFDDGYADDNYSAYPLAVRLVRGGQ